MTNEDLELKVSTLIGKPIRVYKTGDALSQDYVETRVNVEVSESGIIERIWLG